MRLLLKWKQMPKLLRLTPFFSLMVLSLAAAPQSGATPFDETLAAALGNSLSLQSSRQEWLAAREEIGTSVSTSEWRSTGTFTGSHTKKDAASARKSGFLDSQSVNATISLSKNIYDGGQTDQTSQLRQLQLGVAEAKLRAAEQQVLLSAIQTYLSVVKARQEVDLNQTNVDRLEEHVAAATVRLEAGASTQTAVAQAESRLSRARTTLVGSLAALSNAEDTFLSLTGTEAGPVDAAINEGVLPMTLLEADESARRNHPSVALAKLSVDVARQQFNTLLASVRPKVAFSLKATEAMAEGLQNDKTELTAQLQLSTPLMPTLSIKAKSRGLSASLEAAKLARDESIRKASLEVRNAFRNLETARALRESMVVELTALRLAAEGINHEFEFGRKTTLNVLDAERDVNDAEMRRVDADHGALMAAFRLRAASGTLTVESFGLEDVYGPLEQMQPVEPRYKRWIPLEVEFPEEDKTSALEVNNGPGVEVVLPETTVPVAAEIPSLAAEEVVAVSLPAAVTAGDDPASDGPTGDGPTGDGIVWNIQTTPQ